MYANDGTVTKVGCVFWLFCLQSEEKRKLWFQTPESLNVKKFAPWVILSLSMTWLSLETKNNSQYQYFLTSLQEFAT
jgi:hypothetical protein